jgi:hypothetical protein
MKWSCIPGAQENANINATGLHAHQLPVRVDNSSSTTSANEQGTLQLAVQTDQWLLYIR